MSFTLITIWLSFACWWLATAMHSRLIGSPKDTFPENRNLAGLILGWSSLGSILLWTHIILAYLIDHGGSHAAAVQHTEEVLTRQGVGFVVPNIALSINWLFATCWSADTLIGLMMVSSPHKMDAQTRQFSLNSWGWVIRGWKKGFGWFALFIWFNATVVFAVTAFRWLALLLFLGLAFQFASIHWTGQKN